MLNGTKCDSETSPARVNIIHAEGEKAELPVSIVEIVPEEEPTNGTSASMLGEMASNESTGNVHLKSLTATTASNENTGAISFHNNAQQPLNIYEVSVAQAVAKEMPPANLFPIFNRKSAVIAVNTVTSDEARTTEAHEEASVPVPQVRPRKTRRMGRTSSAPNKSNTPKNREDVFSGPSSQPIALPSAKKHVPQIINIVDDDEQCPLTLTSDYGNKNAPIAIDSSPIRLHADSSGKASNDISSQVESKYLKLEAGSSKKRAGNDGTIVWPNKENQHVRGSLQNFPVPRLEFARAFFEPSEEELLISSKFSDKASHDTFRFPRRSERLVERVHSATDASKKLSDIIQSRDEYTVLNRFRGVDSSTLSSSQDTWTEKWRPRCAIEVLGNEGSALYLRDWLLAQEVSHKARAHGPGNVLSSQSQKLYMEMRGAKRPNIIRSIVKPKKRRRVDSDDESLNEWIADDDEDEETSNDHDLYGERVSSANERGSTWSPKLTRLRRGRPSNDEIENLRAEEKPASMPIRPFPTHQFTENLMSTILLSGPSGSGKTAAVYACAEELGWEVFEVYPGIGRRNGASLLSLVGDVSKNHLVGKGIVRKTNANPGMNICDAPKSSLEHNQHATGAKKQALVAFFRDGKIKGGTEAKSVVAGDNSQASNEPVQDSRFLSLFSPVLSTSEDTGSRQNAPRQSIILLEEVDILFGDDTNFWSTVITLIKDARRPVVMTCNGTSTMTTRIQIIN